MTVDEAYDYLCRSMDSGRLAHAFVVAGPPRECGSDLVVRVLGRIVGGENEAARQRVADRTHPDVLWVEPQKRSRVIAVEQVRELQRQMLQTSFEGGWKACVIVGADRLKDQGANAFLKTLEEPPERSLFFLLTDSPQFLLPTISSRCQRLQLATAAETLPDEWHDTLMDICAGIGHGGWVQVMGSAARLAELLKTIKAAAEKEVSAAADEEVLEEDDDTLDARVNSRYREWRRRVMHGLLCWQRDVMMRVYGVGTNELHYADRVEALDRQAARLGEREAIASVQVVEEMNRQLERNLAESAVFEAGFDQLSEPCRTPAAAG